MRNKIYASTGAFLGMANNYDYSVIKKIAPDIHCDGFEFLIYSAWYPNFEKIIDKNLKVLFFHHLLKLILLL